MYERMSGDDLREWREEQGLTAQALGERLAKMLGSERPYTPQEVWNWESGRRDVPEGVERVILRYELDRAKLPKRKGKG